MSPDINASTLIESDSEYGLFAIVFIVSVLGVRGVDGDPGIVTTWRSDGSTTDESEE